MLSILTSAVLFILILGILVVVHEFGHFATAKRFGVEAPEFGIGLPPRLFVFWRMGGWIEIQGERIAVPRNFKLPEELKAGDYVRYKTESGENRKVLTGLDLIPADEAVESFASRVQNVDHGTIFTLNALPIGGFVRMSGEDDPTAPNALAAKPAWQRTIVLVAGVTMNFILAYLTFLALTMGLPHPVVGATTQVLAAQTDMPAAQAGVQAGDTIVSVNGVNIQDNRPAMLDQLKANCGKPVQVGVQRPDPKGGLQNLTLTIAPQAQSDGSCLLGVQINQAIGQPVTAVAPGSLAEQIGIKPGDGLARVGAFELYAPGNTFFLHQPTIDELAKYIQANSLVPTILPVVVVRDSRPITLKVKIPEHVDSQQATLGLTLAPYLNLPQAASEAGSQMAFAVSLLPRAFVGIANGIAHGTDTGVGGPIRIYQAVQEGTPIGGLPFIVSLFANLGLNLAILNLLPFPGLDGGRLAFVILEVLRGGRKVDARVEGIVHLIGFVVLIVFILFVSYGDVQHLLSGKSAFSP
ncbi:MAG: site-2 protease family protein [Anaerolineae bacterium]